MSRPHFPARLSFVQRCSRKCSNNKQRKSRQTEACLRPPAAAAVDDDNCVFLVSQTDGLQESLGTEKKVKGRTGWPQQVWALELNQ